MAKKKEEKEAKVVLERIYVVPLRREWLKVPKYKRAAKAIRGLRAFLFKHMKATEVKIGKYLNEAIWSRGMRNPLHKVKVEAKKDEKGIVFAELVGAPKKEEKEEKKKKDKKEEKPKASPAASKEAAKVEGKEKEEKKEQPKTKKKEVKEAEIVKEEKK